MIWVCNCSFRSVFIVLEPDFLVLFQLEQCWFNIQLWLLFAIDINIL